MFRYVLLCDLDAFFALVEQRDNADLRGKPVIVGGRPDTRGVVSTCSYEARAFGVQSAMPVSAALRLCPEAILIEPHMAKYRKVSGEFFRILDRYSPMVESVSIDEAYLEVVGPQGTGVRVAREIREDVRKELSITVSVGVASNKLLAKIAAGMAKPDGVTEIPPGKAQEVLDGLDVGVLPGIGEKTGRELRDVGIKRVRDLRLMPEAFFRSRFGSRGRVMMDFARGIDARPLETGGTPRSMSEEITFPRDVTDPDVVLSALLRLSEDLGYRLRRSGYVGRTVTLKLRYGDFRTVTRSRTLETATANDAALYAIAADLFRRHTTGNRVRLVGIQASRLVPRNIGFKQGDLFSCDEKEGRAKALYEALDYLKGRFGPDVVRRGGNREGQ